MRIAIVDDDDFSVRMLTVFLKKYCLENNILAVMDKYYSGPELMENFEAGNYDVIFLDIYMDDMTGIEAAAEIRKTDIGCKIVFLTSSSEHMHDAFSCHAFDYIMKPATAERISAIMDDLVRVVPKTERFVEIMHERRQKKLAFSQIKCVISSGHYLIITDIDDNEYSVRMSFSEFNEQTAGDNRFLSINKGIAVNMDHVADISNGECVMNDGTFYPVKVREKSSLENIWEDYRTGR